MKKQYFFYTFSYIFWKPKDLNNYLPYWRSCIQTPGGLASTRASHAAKSHQTMIIAAQAELADGQMEIRGEVSTGYTKL